jgi:hypothetical protein
MPVDREVSGVVKCTPQPTVVMVEGMMEGQGMTELLQFTPHHILHIRGANERTDLSQILTHVSTR